MFDAGPRDAPRSAWDLVGEIGRGTVASAPTSSRVTESVERVDRAIAALKGA